MNGHTPLIVLLLSRGAEASCLDAQGLLFCWLSSHYINVNNYKGQSALHLAKTIECASKLVENGCKPSTDTSGQTVLDTAVQNGNIAVATWLIEDELVPVPEQAKDDASETAVCTSPGSLLLHLLCAQGDLKLVQTVLSKGYSVNCRTEQGHTPIDIAVVSGHVDIVKELLESGADLKDTTIKHATELCTHSKAMIEFLSTGGVISRKRR